MAKVEVELGQVIGTKTAAIVMSSMKMEHVVMPSAPGRVVSISVEADDIVDAGQPLVLLELVRGVEAAASIAPPDLDHIRTDLVWQL